MASATRLPEPPPRKTEVSKQSVLVMVLCTVTAMLYFATVRFEFVYDDKIQIVANPLIRTWTSLPLLFTTDVWRFNNPLVVGNYWRPLFTLWMLVNHSLFGLNPIGWHAMTVAAHIACTVLAFRLLLRLGADQWTAFFAALLFAVHPCHLESVAWISGATDSLACICLLGSLLLLTRTSEGSRSWMWLALSGLLYAAALMAKEIAIIEPLLVAAYLVLFRKGAEGWRAVIGRACLQTSPFVLITLAYLVERHIVLRGLSRTYVNMPWEAVAVTIPSVLWFYIKHLIWPVGLSVVYDAAPVVHRAWSNFWGPLLACLSVGALFTIYVWRTRDRLSLFAGALLMLPLLPVLDIPALEPENFLHDRYLYLPSLGFGILAAIAIQKLFGDRQRVGGAIVRSSIAAGVATLLVVATASQEIYWDNDMLLFSRAAAEAPASALAYHNLGTALAERGRSEEAVFAFSQVIKRNPNFWQAYYHIGLSKFLAGRYEEAEPYLLKAVQLYPVEGDSAAVLAEVEIKLGKFDAAEQAIRHAIAVKPYKPGYRTVLALALEGQGKKEEAKAAVKAELEKHPDDDRARAVLDRLSLPSR